MTGGKENPSLVYEYHPTRSGRAALIFLKGYLQNDAYSGYKAVTIQKNVQRWVVGPMLGVSLTT